MSGVSAYGRGAQPLLPVKLFDPDLPRDWRMAPGGGVGARFAICHCATACSCPGALAVPNRPALHRRPPRRPPGTLLGAGSNAPGFL
jgi:hypothetical protein